MRTPLSTAVAGTIAGIVVAIVYVLSPMTVWLVVAMVPLFVFAGWGLPREERRWVWSLLACALALRILMVLGLLVFTDHEQSNFTSFFFDDDGRASKLRSMWMRNAWLGLPIEPFEYHAFARDYGWTSYLNVIAYVQYLLGPAPYGIHLLNIGFYTTAAVTLHRMARRAYGPFAASIGLGFFLFSPGMVVWSTSAMKESLQDLLIAVTVFGTIGALRGGRWGRRVVAAGATVVAFAALTTVVKPEVALVFSAAVVLGVAGALVIRRRNLLIVSPFVVAIVLWSALQQDSVQYRVTSALTLAVALHGGNVRTVGHGYKLLDERFYRAFFLPGFDGSMTPAQSARFVIRGLASVVLVPLPWQAFSRVEIMFVPAQMYWYCLLLLAAAGLVTALRRDVLVTSVLVVGFALFAGARAITEGNIGTLVRHRDIVMPFIVWISAVGAARGLAWLAGLALPSFASGPTLAPALDESSIPDRAERQASPRGTSMHPGICASFLFIATDSRFYRFVSRRTGGIDLGVPHVEDARALRRLSVLAGDGRLFGLVARGRAAWSGARTVHAVHRRLGEWSLAQRFQVLGWAIAVALVIETVFIGVEGLGVSALGLGMRGLLLAVASLFITTGQPAEAAWHESRFRTMGRRTPANIEWLPNTVRPGA